jgi:hypothetical protein
MGSYFRIPVLALGLLIVCSQLVQGAAPSLGLPISCTPGSDCFIQNYFDLDPGPGARDYACGYLTYDGHTGTDFRLRDLVAMRNSIAVLAAAPGVVIGTRNTEPDVSVKIRGRAALNGMDAGNGVRIDHGDGWTTQYSHMLQGSVKVHVGQKVDRGDILGFVGLSGNTEFPHLDFSVSKDGKQLDPFNPERAGCGAVLATLWSSSVMSSLRYQATGLLISGFSDTPAERDIAEDGGYGRTIISAAAESIDYWFELFGVRKNDHVSVAVYGPDRILIARQEKECPRNMAVLFSSTGRRRQAALWPKGTYSAQLKLIRNGKTIVEERRSVTVK